MRRPAGRLLTVCSALLLLPCATGCRGPTESWAKAQVPWGHVYDVGDTRQIAAWTLRQHSASGISAGWAALRDMILLRPGEADDAIAGMASVYSKMLGGWPGYADPEYPRTELIRGMRRSLAASVRRHPQHPKVAELLATLKAVDPDADDPSTEVPQSGGSLPLLPRLPRPDCDTPARHRADSPSASRHRSTNLRNLRNLC